MENLYLKVLQYLTVVKEDREEIETEEKKNKKILREILRILVLI